MKKLRSYISFVSLGLAGVLCGCNATPEQEERALGYVLGGNARINKNLTPEQRSIAGYTGDIIYDYNIAREGRDQIIIDKDSNEEDNYVPPGTKHTDLGPVLPINKNSPMYVPPETKHTDLGPALPIRKR